MIGETEKPWEITENIYYKLTDGTNYTVPKGFRLDGTSSPRAFWPWLPQVDDRIVGSTLHDHMYVTDFRRKEWGDPLAKKFADENMRAFHDLTSKKKGQNKIIHFLVDKLGWPIFKRWNE